MSVRRFLSPYLIALGILVVLSGGATAQGEFPTSNPSEVFVKGRKVSHSWRQGRVFVPSSELAPLLNLPSDSRDLDLLETLEEKGGYLWSMTEGRLEARPDPALYAASRSSRAASPITNRAVASNSARGNTAESQRNREPSQRLGNLGYEVQRFTADTGYVRAYILVTNKGSSRSDPSEMICQFHDGLGQTFAADRTIVPPLDPGDSQVFEVFSMVKVEDTSLTPTTDNVAVNFFSLTNPNANPITRKQVRQQQRQTKTRRGLDFNKGYGNINRTQTLNNRNP